MRIDYKNPIVKMSGRCLSICDLKKVLKLPSRDSTVSSRRTRTESRRRQTPGPRPRDTIGNKNKNRYLRRARTSTTHKLVEEKPWRIKKKRHLDISNMPQTLFFFLPDDVYYILILRSNPY